MSPRVTAHKEGRLSLPQPGLTASACPSRAAFYSLCGKPAVYIHPQLGLSVEVPLLYLPCCNLWQSEEMRHRKAVLLVFIGLRPYWHKWWARGGGWGPPRAGDKPDPDTKPQAGVCPISLPEPCSIYIERFEELCFYLALKVHFKSIKKRSHWVRQPHLGNSNSLLSTE